MLCVAFLFSSPGDFEKYVSKFSIRFVKLQREKNGGSRGIVHRGRDKVERCLKDKWTKKTEDGGRRALSGRSCPSLATFRMKTHFH